jgi:hypothetical protein
VNRLRLCIHTLTFAKDLALGATTLTFGARQTGFADRSANSAVRSVCLQLHAGVTTQSGGGITAGTHSRLTSLPVGARRFASTAVQWILLGVEAAPLALGLAQWATAEPSLTGLGNLAGLVARTAVSRLRLNVYAARSTAHAWWRTGLSLCNTQPSIADLSGGTYVLAGATVLGCRKTDALVAAQSRTNGALAGAIRTIAPNRTGRVASTAVRCCAERIDALPTAKQRGIRTAANTTNARLTNVT